MTDHDCFTDRQGHLPCTCSQFMQSNSDGTSPHDEARQWADLALDAVLVLLALAALIFTIFSALGFWSNQ